MPRRSCRVQVQAPEIGGRWYNPRPIAKLHVGRFEGGFLSRLECIKPHRRVSLFNLPIFSRICLLACIERCGSVALNGKLHELETLNLNPNTSLILP